MSKAEELARDRKTISHYKILEKLYQKNGGQVGKGGMSSFSKKYNKLIPLAGGIVFTP